MADVYDFIVIGGGPAGMMAAGRAGERGKSVILLEKNAHPGKKLLLCASGRCNVTNTASFAAFFDAYEKAGPFMRPSLGIFSPEKLRSFLSSYGVETIEESKGRVYPKSQKAESVLDALLSYLRIHRITIKKNSRVVCVKEKNKQVIGVETEGGFIAGRNVLIATGGRSYPSTGSTGDGYALASSLGHTICKTYPAIIAFETEDAWVKQAQGTPIKNAQITACQQGRKIAQHFGEALFTHYGISGPAILSISKRIMKNYGNGAVRISIDFKPNMSPAELTAQLVKKINANGGKAIKTSLTYFVPEKLSPLLLNICGIDEKKKASQITAKERKKILDQLKGLSLTLSSHRPIEEAIITGGGIDLNEIESRTMESKLIKGLYLAGEALDVDGPTGGFNLQAAFSTGYLAGNSVM
ncbi:NAD(P)/FAD-dependent oxidoreductase [Candidatus Kuenenia sp.]|uniref:NAD(P)/FAD-dependent oxidoreductase n=1 Tax=Candidatus Kuenenia sp. TaxID=2499824 RepID=UPI0032204E30